MMKPALVLGLVVAAPAVAFAQGNGAALYQTHCASCHDTATSRAPQRDTLKAMTARAILASLVSGTMAVHAKQMSAAGKQAVAEFLGGAAEAAASAPGTGVCAESPLPDLLAGPRWNGWGVDLENTRFQPADQAKLTAADLPSLKLKWAFGFPGASVASGQPAVAGGRLFVASESGVVYAIDAATGCAYWSFTADAGVRTAVSIGRLPGPGPRHVVYFGDFRANVYALDAATGARLWSLQVEDHPFARITGAPVLHAGRLYVPVSSVEEVAGARPDYACCRFRGSVVALDASTGALIWKTYAIAEAPAPTRKTGAGTQLWGPSGAAIWMAPTIDVTRGVLYVGTGNAYSEPASSSTDAILAIDLESGVIRWVRQITPNDVFVIGCRPGSQNCPDPIGPDFDFGSSPILRVLDGGRSILVVGQKSGVAYGLDPDRAGAIVWQFRAGKGGELGGIEWGMAADSRHVYVPVSDVLWPPHESGGLFAVRLDTGARVWYAPPAALTCTGGRGCAGAQSAAITVIPGAVLSGSVDGHLRAFATDDGRLLWDVDTARDFETVNGVKANGGSIDAAGPVVVDGIVYTTSGYGRWRGKPGNVLLAFGRP
jgi:polyvinyl alcohol dehydrogenase (cytochrome)